MYLVTVFSPLIGFFSASLFGRFIGPKGSALMTTSCLCLSAFFSICLLFESGLRGGVTYVELGSWIKSESLLVNWGFMFDSLTVTMCVIVTFVSTLVHIYSTEYMSHDPHLPRFMSYLSLFTFFMLILVTGDNFIQMFLGWEGVGLCSYLLINFWFTRVQANKAAIKAMILNRIGDLFLMLGILLTYVNFKSLNYSVVAALVPYLTDCSTVFLSWKFNAIPLICTFIFLGAMGKSAQLGLHTWLPDAMEGPTPVSALIHAATMVTAGVFLIARCSFLYEYAPVVLNFITFVGASTAFFASSVGLLQNDLKRVIAYSTCSQLGYMVFACGSSDYAAGVFHLSNHAFFKALLFLSAGSVIHAVNDEQDVRRMGGLKFFVPFSYAAMLIGSLALAGFPFLSGFYSKDLVLELAYAKFTSVSHYSYWLGSLGAFLTAFYSVRLLCLTFLTKPNGFKYVICFASETFQSMSFALGVLLIPSMFVGYFSKDFFVGVGSDYFSQSIYVDKSSFHLFDAEFSEYFFKILPLMLSLLGGSSAFYFYMFKKKLLFKLKTSTLGRKCYTFLNKKWFFDKFYNELIGQFFFKWGYSSSYKQIDRGVFEMLGPQGMSHAILKTSQVTHKLQSLSIYHYTLIIFSTISSVFILKFLTKTFFIDFRLLVLIGLFSFLALQ